MTPNRRLRSGLMAAFVLFAVGLTAGCATYSSDYYDSAARTYYRSDRCRTVHRVVTEDGTVVRDSSRLVCAGPAPYYDYYRPYSDRD